MTENISSDEWLKVVALGGLGEIGLNMMAYWSGDDIIVVDCGLMFPEDYMMGVDLVIPDFEFLRAHREQLRGIILTHGHEDHVGAVPYIAPELGVPLFGTPLTLGLVKDKLAEFNLLGKIELRTIHAGSLIKLGCFEIDCLRVTHSIADGLALAIKTNVGTVIHTGDFKLDPTPVDNQHMDLGAFARYGDHGVLALFSDSTNVEREGYTPSEKEVGRALYEVMVEAPGRVIVASFASNIHRIQQVLDVAGMLGRKVCIHGRSMESNTAIAEELGYLKIVRGRLINVGEMDRYPDQEIVLITTGSQGEPLSALSRMAREEHSQIQIRHPDTVILSSKFIPGNEKAIDNLINELYRQGAEVYYEKVSEIHVSGHASREELKFMINLTKPRYFVPIHGEYRHLVRHRRLAMSMGLDAEHCLLAENGDVIYFTKEHGGLNGRIETGRMLIDGKSVGDVGDIILRERRQLSQDGVLLAVITCGKQGEKPIKDIQLRSCGFIFEQESQDLIQAAKDNLMEVMCTWSNDIKSDREKLSEEIRVTLRRFFKKAVLRRPVVVVNLME